MPITRHFLDWNQPALTAAADFVISRYASGDDLDLSRVILVFPGRRAGRRMLELLVQRAGTKWPAMIPPRIVTFTHFPEMLYPQRQQLADDLTQLLVWRKALYAVPPREFAAAIPHRPDEDSVSAWMALCESLRRQHNELAADGLEFDEVHMKLAESGDLEEAERWKALRRIQAEYLMQMDDLKLWDRQAARLVAVQQQECHTDRDIILVGTVDMNRIIRQMLDQVADRVTALIHAPESEQDAFDEYGCVKPDEWETRELNVDLKVTRITGTPAEQALVAVQELAALDGRFRADDITLGVADDAMVPVLLQSLADAGVAGQWPVGICLSETRPYRFLQALALHVSSARDELPADFATLSDLVRHPDVATWILNHLTASLEDERAFSERACWLSDLDEYLADHLQMAPGEMLGREPRRILVAEVCRAVEGLLRCLVPESDVAEFAGSAVGRLRPERKPRRRQRTLDELEMIAEASLTAQLEKRRPLSQWADGAVRVLATMYHDRELHSDSAADKGIYECVSRLQDLNDRLQRVPVAVLPLVSAGQALQLLLKQIAEEPLRPVHNDDAIELLGWLELPLDDSPVLVLTGFNEGRIPESINSDAFMPNSLRTRLDLTDNRRRYARDAYALTAVLHSRKRVVLIKGRTDSQGNPLAPSRLWFAATPKSLPERIRWFYDPDSSLQTQAKIPAAEPVAESSFAALSQSGFAVPEPVNIPPAPGEISVTAFRDYMNCPYRYFLQRELRLGEVDDDVRELTASAFGSLMHEVLNHFGKSSIRNALSSEAIETFLLQELHRVALGQFGRSRSATVSVQLKMLESRLKAFAAWQVKSNQDGWRISHTEQDLQYDDFTDLQGRPVTLIGRVDRIDRHQQTGSWRVLDYKTSETAMTPNRAHRSKGEWVDLQLPLYRLLVRSLGIRNDIQLGYVLLPGDLDKVGIEVAEWTEAELQEAELTARRVAADILDLKIDHVSQRNDPQLSAMGRICQDTVIDRNVPWLKSWRGRSGHE